MKTTNNKQVFEEVYENIDIILTEIGEELMNEETSELIQNNIIDILSILNETKLSKKIKFKLLDIIDILDIDIDE